MNNYFVYRHLFPNGKSYIGITCQNPPSRRWGNGAGYSKQPKMAHAITKYGWSSVRHEILAQGLSLAEANRTEQIYIKQFDSLENGYNITRGGDGLLGVKLSEETKRKIGIANRGKRYPNNGKHLREYTTKHGAWNKGKAMTGEHLRKITEERRRRCNKRIMACDPITHEMVLAFSSCTQAAISMGVSKECISRCAKGERKTSAGYEWRYVDESC